MLICATMLIPVAAPVKPHSASAGGIWLELSPPKTCMAPLALGDVRGDGWNAPTISAISDEPGAHRVVGPRGRFRLDATVQQSLGKWHMPDDNMIPSDASKIVLDEAREAWGFHATGMVWLKWIAVGRGLQECQRMALARTCSEHMTGHAARMAMAGILEKEGLDRIDKGDRSVLMKVMDALPQITTWQDALTTTERVRYNHPRSVWARYQKATMPPRPTATEDGETPAPRGYKAAFVEADAKISILEQRLKVEGPPFNLMTDSVDEIARSIVDTMPVIRAERIARAVLALVDKRQGHAEAVVELVPESPAAVMATPGTTARDPHKPGRKPRGQEPRDGLTSKERWVRKRSAERAAIRAAKAMAA
jgi:hypothetical protein